MSGDQLDLDAIRDRFQRILAAAPVGYVWHAEDDMGTLVEYDVPALVAEVRRLRAQVDLHIPAHVKELRVRLEDDQPA